MPRPVTELCFVLRAFFAAGSSDKAVRPKNPHRQWTAYGRGVKDNDITVLDTGEFKSEFANGAQTIGSKKITTTSTPEHSVISGSGRSSRSRVSVKKVAGEGTKFIGYGVQVKDGAKVAGQYFDPRSKTAAETVLC